ncbi:UNVERIFIED_CONTAM: hypothetical protein FKN15_057293 [Acipenser sinensis]
MCKCNLRKLCKWSGEDKAQQLTTALRGEAQMVLLSLAEEEMGNYHTLQCRFCNTGEPELLRARFRRCARTAGESLVRLATDLKREAHMQMLPPDNKRSKSASSSLKPWDRSSSASTCALLSPGRYRLSAQ